MALKICKELNSSSFSSKSTDIHQNVKGTTSTEYTSVFVTLENKEQYLLTLKSWRVKL